MNETEKERIAIILHSGSYDRVSYALSVATAALATGMEAHVLLTYGGLRRFVDGHTEDLDTEADNQISGSISRGLASGGIQSIEALLANARKLGLKLYACANAMANLNIARNELREEVDEVMGLVTFMKFARTATVNWYIQVLGNTPVLLEQRQALQKMGIPAMVYEASNADPREFDRVKVMDTLDSFLESIGLSKQPTG